MLSYSTCKTTGMPHGLPLPYFLKVDIVYTIRSIPLFLDKSTGHKQMNRLHDNNER